MSSSSSARTRAFFISSVSAGAAPALPAPAAADALPSDDAAADGEAAALRRLRSSISAAISSSQVCVGREW
jgi:hypothetical protein